MAPPSNLKLLLFLTLTGILSFSASARPCKTILISSYSFVVEPRLKPNYPSSSGFFTVVAEIRPRYPSEIIRAFSFDESAPRIPVHQEEQIPLPFGFRSHLQRLPEEPRPVLPLGFSSYNTTSFRDRAKDILSVVIALLFGVGCGALTAAAMYLLWSLVYTRFEYRYGFEGEEHEEDADDVFSPKKMGYVKIPPAESVPEPVKNAV